MILAAPSGWGAGSGVAISWGRTFEGQLGNGTGGSDTSAKQTAPGLVDTAGVLAGKSISAVSMGNAFGLALDSSGKIYSWGSNSFGTLGTTAIPTSSGYTTTPIAVDMTGVLSGKTVTAISAGLNSGMALTSEGKVYAWGTYSALGDGTNNPSAVPVAVDMTGVLSGKTVTAISAGANFYVALASDGKVYTWGDNGFGQLGNNSGALYGRSSLVPVAVDASGVLAGKTVTAIAAGASHVLVLTADNKLFAWGAEAHALGAGSAVALQGNGAPDKPVAVDMSGVLNGRTVVQIAAGENFSVALTSDGKVFTWGYEGNGNLGNGTTGYLSSQYVPVAVDMTGVLAGLNVTGISCSSTSVVVQASDGKLYAWGDNTYGALGVSGVAQAMVPIAVDSSGLLSGYSVTTLQSGSGGGEARSSIVIGTVASVIAPAIITQPVSQTVTAGNAVTFSVTATGTSPSYQWKKDGTAIVGATNASFSLSTAAAPDAGTYTVVVSNSAGNVTSTGAVLTISAAVVAPAITTQPVSVTVTSGGAASFTVAASGNPAPTYQWQKGGVAISGATSATYSIASVVAGDAGNYAAVATNSAGTATSTTATLTVSAATSAPAIATQPSGATVTAGSSVSFTVAASGIPTPTYQWQKDGAVIAGATSTTYTIASVVAGDAGNYAAVATNSAGSATSAAATLTVSAATASPSFTTQPASMAVTTGGAASFTVAANGNPAPTYQWYFGGTAITGATSATLNLSNVQASNAGDYYAIATNSGGTAISTTAKLTVQAPTPLTLLAVQPVTVGHDVAISATGASGTIQWQVSSDAGVTWQNLADSTTASGTTTSILEILKVTATQNGYLYHCVVSGTASSSTKLVVMDAFFPFPTAVGPDSAGNLFVSDASAQTIQKINPTDQVTLVAGTTGVVGSTNGSGSAAKFNQPGALAAAADGTLSVSDTTNDLIRSISASGVVTTLAGSAGVKGGGDGTGAAARFASPIGIARDASGVLFVADSLNDTIRKITSAGVVTTFAGSAGLVGSTDASGANARFTNPAGIAIDASGNVFVADAANNTIRKLTPAGAVTTLAGAVGVSGNSDGTGTAARFNNPGGLAINSSGDLYLADTGNSTIRKITSAGVVTTVAGMAGTAGLMDGTGSYAWFDLPEGVTIGTDGNLYIADTGNAVIRKVTLAGVVTTLPLTAGPISSSGGASGAGGSGSKSSGGGSVAPWFGYVLGLFFFLRVCIINQSFKSKTTSPNRGLIDENMEM